MIDEHKLYLRIGQQLPKAEESQLFGKPCFKINKKAFFCFFQEKMVFKLFGEAHPEALSNDGSKLFDPSGKGKTYERMGSGIGQLLIQLGDFS